MVCGLTGHSLTCCPVKVLQGVAPISRFLHAYLRAFAAPTSPWRWFTLAHSLVGALGSVALGLVGAINDHENYPLHLSAATTFFLAILAWQLSYTAQLAAHPSATSPASLRLKVTCTVATSTALVAFFTLAGIDYAGYYTEIAVCEWIAAVASMASLWSLSLEFEGDAAGAGTGGAAAERGMELGSLWRGPLPSPEVGDVDDNGSYHIL